MGAAYPELVRGRAHAERVLKQEEERFAETLANGMALLEGAIRKLRGAQGDRRRDGLQAVRHLRLPGRPHRRHRARARPDHRPGGLRRRDGGAARAARRRRASSASTCARGTAIDARTAVPGLRAARGERPGGRAAQGRRARRGARARAKRARWCSTARRSTPSPAARWAIPASSTGGRRALPRATTRRSAAPRTRTSARSTQGTIRIGDALGAQVDGARRQATALNHTATHLLHAALRKVLGTHVQQKGSLVAPDRLRFDFSHFQPVTPDELQRDRAAGQRARSAPTRRPRRSVMDYDDAVAAGAMALFGEKYDKDVRVLRIGDFSMELCGGTHVQRAGDIGLFKILSESGVAAGVRRIEAMTGEGALDYVEQNDALLQGRRRPGARLARGAAGQGARRARAHRGRWRRRSARSRTGWPPGRAWILPPARSTCRASRSSRPRSTAPMPARCATRWTSSRTGSSRRSSCWRRVEDPAKVVLVAGVTADQTARIKAGELVGAVAAQVGGRGGGRAGFRAGRRQQARGARCGARLGAGVRARAAGAGVSLLPHVRSFSMIAAPRTGPRQHRPPPMAADRVRGEMAEWSKAHPC